MISVMVYSVRSSPFSFQKDMERSSSCPFNILVGNICGSLAVTGIRALRNEPSTTMVSGAGRGSWTKVLALKWQSLITEPLLAE